MEETYVLANADHQKAVDLLLAAERDCRPIPRLSDSFPGMSIADAYAIQRQVVDAKLAAGGRIRGHKVGLTSRVMQESVGIDEPDFGHLLDESILGTDRPIAVDRFLVPRIEVELAFVLGRPLRGPDVTIADVLMATDFVQPALEIIDSRTETPRTVVDTIADNSACGAVVLGGRPVPPTEVDLRWVAAVLYRNAVIEESGVSSAVLGHPAAGVAWLANRLATFDTALEPGHVVLAGSFTRPVPLAAGDIFHVDYGQLGSIALAFA
ncbi:2-keto-4-pentenoate hydratase [Halomonas ramblicola]|uniref:2-keto-4-pentenoate hydratase n=1 Tax=Halomonas ramblicola TaxID=747349 RepID=UPI0025B29152|nr:fumarylacetoacetate hydrolase family protein [Halomonas ramblicola]MDN3522008.1 fumarylacetoacetate hydrolase family protein [Halomonas ramblicola]